MVYMVIALSVMNRLTQTDYRHYHIQLNALSALFNKILIITFGEKYDLRKT